jgi:hypothetical protein
MAVTYSYQIGYASQEPAPCNWYLFVNEDDGSTAAGDTLGPFDEQEARKHLADWLVEMPGEVKEIGDMNAQFAERK